MRRTILIAALMLLAAPAQAEWQFTDVSDSEGKAYKGWSVDVTGNLEAQIFCDDWFPGDMDLTIYTSEDYDTENKYAKTGTLTVTIDDRKSLDVEAFYDEHDGELLVYTSSLEVEGVDKVLLAMARANTSIGFAYMGREFRFPADNVQAVVEKMSAECPS